MQDIKLQKTLRSLFYLTLGLSIVTNGFVRFEPAPTDILSIMAVFIAFLYFYNQDIQPDSPLFSMFYLFIFSNVISIFSAYDQSWALQYLGITIYLVLFMITISLAISHFGLSFTNNILLLFAFSVVFYCLIGAAAAFQLLPSSTWFFRGGADEFNETGFRVSGTFKDPNVFGPYAAAGVVIFCHLLVQTKTHRLLFVAATAACFIGVMVSFSRGAYLNLAVSLFFLYLFNVAYLGPWSTTLRLLKIGLPISPLIVGGIVYVLLSLNLIGFLETRLGEQVYDSSRFDAQKAAIKSGIQNPLGIGPGHFTVSRGSFKKSKVALDPHNVYLRVLAENGILGFITFLGAMIILVFTTMFGILKRNDISRSQVLIGSLLMGIFANSLFIDTLHWRHFLFLLGIASGLTVLQRSSQKGISLRRSLS